MKKTTVLLALLLALALAMGGCSSGGESSELTFSADTNVENMLYIYANGAAKGDSGRTTISVAEGQALYFEVYGEEGEEMRVAAVPWDGNADEADFSGSAGAAVDDTLTSGSSGVYYVGSGTYAVLMEVTSDTFTGTAASRVWSDDEAGETIENPWSTTEDMGELEEALGFSIEVPETLGDLVIDRYYSYAPEMQMAEIKYVEVMEDGTLWMKGAIRKAPADAVDPAESFSGVWDEYDGIYEVSEGLMYSYKDDLVYQAEWEKDGYHYSIFHQDGLEAVEMTGAVSDVH
ncbi:MAG: hypothetical protein K5772_05210 [Clostridia bacterium]|nr:hypothetical protein [Clostridia bacterium]